MIGNKALNFHSLFFQVFCLKFPPVYKPLLILSMHCTCTPSPFLTKIKPSSSRWILVPIYKYLIAFYQRIVELWCRAKNFPNDPRIYSHSLIRFNVSSENYDFGFNIIQKINFSKNYQFKCIRKQIWPWYEVGQSQTWNINWTNLVGPTSQMFNTKT